MKFSDKSAMEAGELAARYFLEEKSNCAEAVIRAVMRVCGKDCPVELLKMASPFGRGMGEAGCVCGALVGAQMAMGIFLGRTEMAGATPPECAKASRFLHDRFKKALGATCCRILHKGEIFGSEEQRKACAARSGKSAELAINVLKEMMKENIGQIDRKSQE